MTTTLTPPAEVEPPGVAKARDSRRTLLGFIATRRVTEIVLILILGVGGALLMFGANFGLHMVHSQLDAQAITFPVKGSAALSPAEFPGLQRYAGQKVNSGPKAKAYANLFINKHLAAVANGQTYSQVSASSIAHPNDAKLSAEAATLFKGETLRGLLLYAWGWSVVSNIALYAGIAALAGFLIMLLVTLGDFLADPQLARRR